MGGSEMHLITLSNCRMFVNDKIRRNANNDNDDNTLSRLFDIFCHCQLLDI